MSHSREAQSLAIQCKDLCASVLSKCSTENIVKSATAGNHSILALSKVHQPTAARRMQERAAVGLTLIETFWNFFVAKMGQNAAKGAKKGQKKSGLS